MKTTIRLLMMTVFGLVVSCRLPAPPSTTVDLELRDTPDTSEFPDPGERIPLDRTILGTTRFPSTTTNNETTTPPQRAVSGEVETMGPFSAADAGDGKWIKIRSLSGIRYVLVPGRLWVRSGLLHINEGDGISATGYVLRARGRTYLYARSIGVD